MKSVVATRYGGPEALAIVDRDEPVVRPGDVRIRVRAASLNPIDFKIRQGKLRLAMRLEPPIALGCDVAGVVDAVGEQVSSFAVGDEVYARLEKDRMGGLSELVAADQAVVARKPARATFEEAAAVPLAGLTAGQRVLVHAGAGGVGSLAIQIGKALGLWVATTTSTKNVELVTGLGADLVIDYTRESPRDRLSELDAVFDTLGGQSELEALTLVRRGGTVVGIGGLPDAAFARARLPWWARPLISVATLRRRRAAARAGARFLYLFMRPDGAELAELAAWIDDGRLRPLIHRAYPLADVGEAFAELERGRARGKIVVTIPA